MLCVFNLVSLDFCRFFIIIKLYIYFVYISFMRQQPSDSSSTWKLILQNWDDRYVRELNALGYISPLATILYHAFVDWNSHTLYQASLIHDLLSNNNIGVYTVAQLQNFQSDLAHFSTWWFYDKPNGKILLQQLRIQHLGKDFLADTTFSSHWLGDCINQHILGVLDARVKQWIKLKSSPDNNLFHVLQ